MEHDADARWTVRTIRLMICKQPLMIPCIQGMPETSIKTGPLQAPRGNQARAPAFIGTAHLIRQPTALLLLPAPRNSLLLVASSSRQVKDVMVVSSGFYKDTNRVGVSVFAERFPLIPVRLR